MTMRSSGRAGRRPKTYTLADSCTVANRILFDHPVSLRDKGGWKIEANCFRGFQANDQFKSTGPLGPRKILCAETAALCTGKSFKN
jgi:hypothetical protein